MERELKIGGTFVRLKTNIDGTVRMQAWFPEKHPSLLTHNVPESDGWAPWSEYQTVSEALARAELLADSYVTQDAQARAREASIVSALETLVPQPVDAESLISCAIQRERDRVAVALAGIPRSKDNRVTLKRALAVVLPGKYPADAL
jgi:hypothetical protein